MNFAGLIYLLVAHYLSGKGLLRLLRVDLKGISAACFSMILGVPLLSFAPCILQLLNIPIATLPVLLSVAVITALFSIPLLIKFKKPVIGKITLPAVYEWPFLAVFAFLIAISIWRCFYFPPYARDMLAGPELLAEYAVREKTMVSSVFTIDLQTSNNYFKSPFITGLQIIYKLLVCPFGQLWLSILFTSFIVWLYTILRRRIHPLLAGFLLFFFITIPDLYAYTYVILYDYSNMVFFFCGFYFLARYFEQHKQADILFSAVLFGIATYIRTETLLLVVMTAPLLAVYFYRQHIKFKNAVLQLGMFLIIPALFYFLCINVFIRLLVPLPFDLSGQISPDLKNVSVFFERLKDIHSELIFSIKGIGVYGYFMIFFYGLFIADLIFIRKFTREAQVVLYGIAVVIVGLALIGYLLPVADLGNTTKRGLFKLLPLMLLYMANSGLLQKLSGAVRKWEYAGEKVKDVKEV